MAVDRAMSPELQILFDRVEAARNETHELMAENARWRRLAADQLRHMYVIGQGFRQRPTIQYP